MNILSRGAAKECSLGREPGEHSVARSSPGGAEGFEVCRPFGTGKGLKDSPRADARGYSLLPLRG